VTPTPDAAAFAAALRAAGLACDVEARAALALIIVSAADAARVAADDDRRRVLALAREHGFTHVAVELPADAPDGDAPLLRH
jgi:sugar phosphate isomerase/epimerase